MSEKDPGDTRIEVDREGDISVEFKAGWSHDKQDYTQDFVIIDHSMSADDHSHVVFDSEGNEIHNDSGEK